VKPVTLVGIALIILAVLAPTCQGTCWHMYGQVKAHNGDSHIDRIKGDQP